MTPNGSQVGVQVNGYVSERQDFIVNAIANLARQFCDRRHCDSEIA
jgi:hypothetical protein